MRITAALCLLMEAGLFSFVRELQLDLPNGSWQQCNCGWNAIAA